MTRSSSTRSLTLLLTLTLALHLSSAMTTPWQRFFLNRNKRQDGDEDAGDDGELEDEGVDLHSGEFCVDVSTFGDIVFENQGREACDTTFEKVCETKTEQMCDEVTEIQCDVVPYTECAMEMEETPYKSYDMENQIFRRKSCTEGMDVVQHTKMMPECRNVTKQNCITKWETDDEGNQVWAGNEACEPVTWRECKLVPRQVDFKVPKVECTDGEEIPYTELIDVEKIQMTTKMLCEVKKTTSCKPVISTKCSNIEYQECTEEPVEECVEREMMIPTQEKEHKKKCLLPDDSVPRQGRLTVQGRGEQRQKRPVGERRKKKKQQQQRRREEESEEILVAANFDAESAELALEREDSFERTTSSGIGPAPAPQLPLAQLGVAASNRNTRRYQGQQPQVVSHRRFRPAQQHSVASRNGRHGGGGGSYQQGN